MGIRFATSSTFERKQGLKYYKLADLFYGLIALNVPLPNIWNSSELCRMSYIYKTGFRVCDWEAFVYVSTWHKRNYMHNNFNTYCGNIQYL